MEFYDLQAKTKSKDINFLFPEWHEQKEHIAFFSPHDDDVILGAGYSILSCLKNGSDVYVIIFNDGSAGYTTPEMKEKIIEIRKKETTNAFKKLGILENHIIRFNLPDFTGMHHLGWKLPWGGEGIFSKVISTLRSIKATRLIFPNSYREHIDHTSASLSAMFDGPQAGDSILSDRGKPSKIRTYLQYSVWGKLSPEDALINKRNTQIRANRAIVVKTEIENKIINSIMEFKSQQDIISYILNVRKERRFIGKEKYIEVYLEVDPRPRFDYEPYKKLIFEIDG